MKISEILTLPKSAYFKKLTIGFEKNKWEELIIE